MKARNIRVLLLGVLVLVITAPLYAPPGCTPEYGYFCAKTCDSSGYCWYDAPPNTMCEEIPGGCASMVNTDCCPGR